MYKNAKGMKKSLFILIGLLTSMTFQAAVLDYEKDGLVYQYDPDLVDPNTHEGVASLVNGRNVSVEILNFILPYFEIDGVKYNVTSIGEAAFTTYADKKYTGNTSIEYVIIPEGVTTIEANAFNNCSNIKLLELPSTFTTIGTNAFNGCSRLVYVCCNSSNANLSIPSFLPNNELMSLFVPVGSATDSEGGYLNTATTNKWKERFGDRIYAGKMEIHSSTDSVGMDYVCATGNGSDRKAILYNGDKNRKKVVVPSSFTGDDSKTYNVVGIGRSAFEGSTELDSLIIEDGVITINNLAFQNCKKLRKLTIPSTLRTIGSSAFNECNIKHVWCKVADATILDATKFPNKGMMTLYVSDVDEYSDLDKGKWKAQFSRIFQGDMVSITDSLGNKYVCSTGAKEATLFEGINNDVEIPATITIKNYKVTGIDRGAFQNCTEITKVTIPSSVTAIGSNAFNGCSNLTIVHFKSENPFEIAENVFSSKSKATLFIPQSASYNNIAGWNFQDVEKCDEIERFEYDGMWYIGWKVENDFFAKLIKGKPSIANVPISVPYSANDYNVTSIGESAFSGVKNIEILDLSLVGLKRIEANAFKNSADLKRITLPSTLEIIGDKAFNGCNNLVEVESKSSAVIPDINSKNVFPDDDIILYIPSNCTEQQYISKGWNVAHVFLGNRVPYQDENNVNTYVYGSADNTNIVVLLSSTKRKYTT